MEIVSDDVKAYRQCPVAGFILNALYVFNLITSWGWWYAISFIPVDNLNHLMQGKWLPSQRHKKDKKKQMLELVQSWAYILGSKQGGNPNGNEDNANKHERWNHLHRKWKRPTSTTMTIQPINLQNKWKATHPSRCKNRLASWKFLLSKLRIYRGTQELNRMSIFQTQKTEQLKEQTRQQGHHSWYFSHPNTQPENYKF